MCCKEKNCFAYEVAAGKGGFCNCLKEAALNEEGKCKFKKKTGDVTGGRKYPYNIYYTCDPQTKKKRGLVFVHPSASSCYVYTVRI